MDLTTREQGAEHLAEAFEHYLASETRDVVDQFVRGLAALNRIGEDRRERPAA